jgi:hypothetical protein
MPNHRGGIQSKPEVVGKIDMLVEVLTLLLDP